MCIQFGKEMSVKPVSVKLNRPQDNNENEQGKVNKVAVTDRNLPALKRDEVSFKGMGNFVINFMDGIARGGFIAAFLSQDFVGMVAPRVGKGLLRNSEETGQLNWDFARREALRECISGPSVFVIPLTMLHFIKKAGTANNVPVDYIRGFGEEFEKFASKSGIDFTDKTKVKREYYSQVFEKVLTTSVNENEMSQDEITKTARKFADELIEIENSKSKGFFKNISGKAVEGSKEDRLAKLTDEFIAIRKKHTTPGTQHWNAEMSTNSGKNIVEHFKGFSRKLVDYTNDITGNVAKLANEKKSLSEILDYVKNHTPKRMGSRAITNIGMWLAVVTFYFFIPKIYNMGLNGKNPGMTGISTEEQDNLIFGQNEDLKKAKGKKAIKNAQDVNFSGKGNIFKKVSKALDNNKFLKKISDFFEFDGPSMTVNSTLALLFGFCLPTRLMNTSDKHDRKETIRRDITSFFAILFGAKTLSRMFSKLWAVTSGLALNVTPEDHTRNIFRKIKNYVVPNGGISILQSDEIVAKYSNIQDYRGGINDFFSYVQDNGGNVKRMLMIDKDIRKNVETIMGKDLEKCENHEIIGKFKEITDGNIIRSNKDELEKIYAILQKPDNSLVKKAKTLNSSFGFLSIIVLVPAFMIWLADRCEKMTKKDIMKEQFLNIAKDYMNEDFVTADNDKIRALDEKVMADVKAGKIYGFKFDEKTNTIRDLKGKARQVSDIRVLIKKHIDMQMPKEKKQRLVKQEFLTNKQHIQNERKMAA